MSAASSSRRLWAARFALLLGTVALLVGVDRVLFHFLANRLWVYDPVLHYRQRPNGVGRWPDALGGKPIRFNSLGLHDEEFPVAKPPGERRILVVGDSVAMGHGVTAAEAFPNQLERLLRARGGSVQVVNAGVQGYATDQYVEVLRRGFEYSPELVMVAFCMNDVLDPLRVRQEHGGAGFDYHRVLEDPLWLRGFLLNETGFGRLTLRMRFRDFNDAAGRAALSVERMIQGLDTDRRVRRSWTRALGDLGRFYALAREGGVVPILLIFPYDFQVGVPELQEPQQRLVRHARAGGVRAVDLTPLFEELRTQGWANRDLFLDRSHLTPRAHEAVARRLRRLLRRVDGW